MELHHFISESVPQSVLNYVKGWTDRQAELVTSSMADDAVYIDKPHPLIPRAKMQHHLEQVAWSNFPDMTFDTLSLFGTEGYYAWEWALHASTCGIIVGDTSQRRIYCEGVDIMRLNAEGKIIQSVCHIDRK